MSEVRLATPVKATKVMSIDDLLAENCVAGAFAFAPRGTTGPGLAYNCPCGCGSLGHLPIYREGDSKPAPNAWLWDGNEVTPTLSPSIRQIGHWHGFLQQGEWRQA